MPRGQKPKQLSGKVIYLPNNDPPEVNEARYRRGLRAFSDAIDYIEALESKEGKARANPPDRRQ